MQVNYLPVFIFVNILYRVEGQSVFPTQIEQVNLLSNVHELFKEIKQSVNNEQMTMDESMKIELELMMKRSKFTISTLQELTMLKLISTSNSVCALDAREEMADLVNQSYNQLKQCFETGIDEINKNSLILTSVSEKAVADAELFLDKLNQCSVKKGLAVIACYRKIIQEDVIPVKAILSEAIKSHQTGHLQAFKLKGAVDICVDTTIDELKDQLEKSLDKGLNCS